MPTPAPRPPVFLLGTDPAFPGMDRRHEDSGSATPLSLGPSHLANPLFSSSVVLLLGLSTAHGGSLQIQTENTDTLAQWTVNQTAVGSTGAFGVPDTTTAELTLDDSSAMSPHE